jgi:hypothetical protein
MKEEFVAYLKSIGITSVPFLKRVEEIHDFAVDSGIIRNMDDILVEDYINSDGSREYTCLNFFSADVIFSANGFLIRDDFAASPTVKDIYYLKINKESYDFKNATEHSRLTVDLYYSGLTGGGNYKAAKENCDQLRKMILKYFVPNLRSRSRCVSL